jgi:hypothetical protein
MTDRQPDNQPAQFVYSFEPTGLAKLFIGKDGRRHLAAGRLLRVSVFPWGFEWIKGDEELSARWGEVSSLTQGVTKHLYGGFHSYTDYVYWVTLSNRQSFSFSGRLSAAETRGRAQRGPSSRNGATTAITIEQLGRIFTERVTSVMLPVAMSRFNAGQSTSFGVLTVGPAGIAVGGESVTWDEVHGLQARGGVVSVMKKGERRAWKGVPVFMVPNYFVFDALVRTVLTQRSADGRG